MHSLKSFAIRQAQLQHVKLSSDLRLRTQRLEEVSRALASKSEELVNRDQVAESQKDLIRIKDSNLELVNRQLLERESMIARLEATVNDVETKRQLELLQSQHELVSLFYDDIQ